MVPADQDAALLVEEHGVGRTVARTVQYEKLAVAEREPVAMAQFTRDGASRAERSERRADRPEDRRQLGGDAMPAHHALREVVVVDRAALEIGEIGPEQMERR